MWDRSWGQRPQLLCPLRGAGNSVVGLAPSPRDCQGGPHPKRPWQRWLFSLLKGLTFLPSHTLPKTPPCQKINHLHSNFFSESTSEGAQSKITIITEQRLDRHVRRKQQSALRRGDEAAPCRPDFVALGFQNSIFSHVDHECSVGLR